MRHFSFICVLLLSFHGRLGAQTPQPSATPNAAANQTLAIGWTTLGVKVLDGAAILLADLTNTPGPGPTLGQYIRSRSVASALASYVVNVLVQAKQNNWDFKKVNYMNGILPSIFAGVASIAGPILLQKILPQAVLNSALYPVAFLVASLAAGFGGAKLGYAANAAIARGVERVRTGRSASAPQLVADEADPFSRLENAPSH